MSNKETRTAEEMMLYDKDVENKIAYLTLNRPDKMNAPDIAMKQRFSALLRQADVDNDVKVLVIRGAGDHLGTGADLEEMLGRMAAGDALYEFGFEEGADVTCPPMDSFRYNYNTCALYASRNGGCRSLQEFKKISILEVKGYCYGWHFYLAGDADIVISSDDALFGHPSFRYMGWGPRMWTWVETMGLRKFQEMLFSGRPFTAAEMEKCNFINSLVPRDQLEDEVQKYALAFARNAPTDRIVMQKTFLEIYKQQRGEYLGSMLSSVFEAMGAAGIDKIEEGEFSLNSATMEKGISKAVKESEQRFPPEWHLGQWGRKKEDD